MNLFKVFGYPLFIVAGLQIYLGALLIRYNPLKSRVNKSVAAFSFLSAAYVLANAVSYILSSMGKDFNFFNRAAWVGWLSIPACLQFLHYLRDENSPAARRIGWVLYPFWTAVLLLTLLTDAIEPGDTSLIPYINRRGPLEDPLRLLGSAMIIWIMFDIMRLRREVGPIRRRQLDFMFYGTLIFAAGGVAVVGLVQVFGEFGVNPSLGAYFSLPWVVLTFYAITRHRLFDIRIVVSDTIAILLVSVLFFGASWPLFETMRPITDVGIALVVSPSVVGLIFFGTPFTRRIIGWMRRIIVKDRYEYQAVLKRSLDAITSILDLDSLLNYIIGNIRKSFGVERISLFLPRSDGGYKLYPSIAETKGMDKTLPECVVRLLKQAGHAMLRHEMADMLSDEGPALAAVDASPDADILFVPMVFKAGMQGVLVLGPKRSGEPYIQSDIELLETLASQTAVAIENARLYDEARNVKRSLLESEERFRALAETTPAAIFIHRNGEFLYVNPAGEAIIGCNRGDLCRIRFMDIVHPAYRDLVSNLRSDDLYSDRGPQQYEFKIMRKDGEERWVLMTTGPIEYAGGDAVVCTLFDITERVALEGRLRNVQKMEAIGKLAAGVAHDFNNILTTIVGHGALLQMKMGKDDPLRRHIDQIMSATERAANLTQSLLSFGRKQVVDLKPADLNDIVRGMEKLLLGVIGENIELVVRLAQDSLAVAADCGQMDRVIMNLVVNARDAMPSGGRLTIGTELANVDDEFIKVHGFVRKGSYAVLYISDTGVGMDDKTREKIFEPFFTTKKEGSGTGFGLAIAYEIVKLHKGYITVESELGKGSTFRVFLPLLDQAIVHHQPEYVATGIERSETVLVADDDEDVRRFARAALEAGGYMVIEAADGEEAVARFRQSGDGIGLAVIDIMIPKMNGTEVCDAILKTRADAKVLFMSGYTEDVLRDKGLLSPGRRFILKPFSPRSLLECVNDMLGRRR